MRRSIGFTFIGVISLSIGMSIWLLLTLLLRDQQQYDTFHDSADRIVRVTSNSWNRSIDLMVPLASSPAPVGPTLVESLPEVEAFVRLARVGAGAVTEKGVIDLQSYATDPSFFEVFDFELEQGFSSTALSNPNTLVITEEAALKLFNSTQVLGQFVQLGTLGEFEITGIVKNPPRQSHLQFEALISMGSLTSGYLSTSSMAATLEDWQSNSSFWNYLLVQPGVDAGYLQSNINRVLLSHYPDELKSQWMFQVEPLTDIVLVNRDLGNQIGPVVGQRALYVVSLFAFVILLIAIFNYVGLAVSRSLRRSREVGVRKVLGADRSQLIQQFLSESILVSLSALLLSTLALIWLVPLFNNLRFMQIAGVHLGLEGLRDPSLMVSFVGISLVVGFIAGIAPALHLSRFQTAHILSGSFKHASKRQNRVLSRRTLISLQFAASLFFVVIASAMWMQIDKMLAADFGFQGDELIAVDLQGIEFDQFKNTTSNLASVEAISAASALPVAGNKALTYIQSDSLPVPLFTYWYSVDASMFEIMGLELAAGRAFNENRSSDQSDAVILNETAARELGFRHSEDAIDQWIHIGLEPDSQVLFNVIGVVQDFYFESDRNQIRRMVLFNDPAQWNLALVVPSAGTSTTQTDLSSSWDELQTGVAYSSNTFEGLLSDVLLPAKDARFILTIAAALAIFLSCLGLISFAAFTAQTRRREIALRKVVGASTFKVTWLMLSDFLKLMGVGVILAIPITVIAHSVITQNFPFPAKLGPMMVFLQISTVMLLGLMVTCLQVVRVAFLNPTRVLRTD